MTHRHLEDGGKAIRDDDDYFFHYEDDSFDAEDYSIVEDYFAGADEDSPPSFLIRNGLLALLCLCVAFVEAGLLMGVMNLDPLTLEVRARTAPTEVERRQAQTLLEFVRRRHLVMVAIIVVNVAVNEALPVFLDRLIPTYLSVLVSTTLVVFVGEILPSALFTGSNQIALVYRFLPVIRATILLTACVSVPLSRFLDAHIDSNDGNNSNEGGNFSREEINAFVRIKFEQLRKRTNGNKRSEGGTQKSVESTNKDQDEAFPELLFQGDDLGCLCGGAEQVTDALTSCGPIKNPSPRTSAAGTVDWDDLDNIKRILNFREMRVEGSFTPLYRVYAISAETIIDDCLVVELYRRRFSRVPVYQDCGFGRSTFVGILFTAQLLVVDRTIGRRVGTMPLYRPICCGPQTTLAELMELFRKSRKGMAQLAVICNQPFIANAALDRGGAVPFEAEVRGIITYEDVLRVIVGHVPDEKRRYNSSSERARWAVGKWKSFVLNRRTERERLDQANKLSFRYNEMAGGDEAAGGLGRGGVTRPLPDLV